MKDYNFYFKINLRCPRYCAVNVSSSLDLSNMTQGELRRLLAVDLGSESKYPAGSVESIAKGEYDKAMGWEG